MHTDIQRATLDTFLCQYPPDLSYGTIVDAIETDETITWIARWPIYADAPGDKLAAEMDRHTTRLLNLVNPYRKALHDLVFVALPKAPATLHAQELLDGVTEGSSC